jgi:hypothetical protein
VDWDKGLSVPGFRPDFPLDFNSFPLAGKNWKTFRLSPVFPLSHRDVASPSRTIVG